MLVCMLVDRSSHIGLRSPVFCSPDILPKFPPRTRRRCADIRIHQRREVVNYSEQERRARADMTPHSNYLLAAFGKRSKPQTPPFCILSIHSSLNLRTTPAYSASNYLNQCEKAVKAPSYSKFFPSAGDMLNAITPRHTLDPKLRVRG